MCFHFWTGHFPWLSLDRHLYFTRFFLCCCCCCCSIVVVCLCFLAEHAFEHLINGNAVSCRQFVLWKQTMLMIDWMLKQICSPGCPAPSTKTLSRKFPLCTCHRSLTEDKSPSASSHGYWYLGGSCDLNRATWPPLYLAAVSSKSKKVGGGPISSHPLR